jgi:hypothetical protein
MIIIYCETYQDSLPSPVAILLLLGQSPHVEVRFDDLRPQDVVLLVGTHRLGLGVRIKAKRFWTELRC